MKKDDGKYEVIRALALLTQLGISMAACVFAGVMAGKLLDMWLGTSPWLLVVFSLIGGAASFRVMYELTLRGWFGRGKNFSDCYPRGRRSEADDEDI